jgi:hypothetical protein
MKFQKSFTLVELLVYIAVTSIFIPMLFSTFSRTLCENIKNKSFHTKVIRNSLVMDLVRRDLMSASLGSNDWDTRRCIFKKKFIEGVGTPSESWIGWSGREGVGLVRLRGEYSKNSRCWIKKETQTFGCSIKDLSISISSQDARGNILAVSVCYLFFDSEHKEDRISLRNRVLS